MTNKFVPTYWSLESSNYFFGSYMTNGRQRVIRSKVATPFMLFGLFNAVS